MRALWPILLASIVLAPRVRGDDDKAKDPIRVRTEAAVDKAAVKIGERFTYTITITADEGVTTRIPQVPKDLGPFTVLDVKREPPVIGADGKTVAKVTCTLTAYELGKLVIPATEVKYDLKDGARGITTTEAVAIDVESVLPSGQKMKDIRDIRDIYDFSPTPKETPAEPRTSSLALLVLLVLLFVGAVLGVYLYRGRTARARLLLPHEFALAELETLRNTGLLKEGRVKEYFYRLSLIARRYVESRFRLRAPERTTEEFLVDLAETDLLRSSEKALLGDLLKQCDRAKYAKHRPDPSRSTAALNDVVQFVHLTQPPPEAQAGRAA